MSYLKDHDNQYLLDIVLWISVNTAVIIGTTYYERSKSKKDNQNLS